MSCIFILKSNIHLILSIVVADNETSKELLLRKTAAQFHRALLVSNPVHRTGAGLFLHHSLINTLLIAFLTGQLELFSFQPSTVAAMALATLFKSEPMTKCRFFLPPEAAYNCVAELGEVEIEFIVVDVLYRATGGLCPVPGLKP